jgi:hypothetical protein
MQAVLICYLGFATSIISQGKNEKKKYLAKKSSKHVQAQNQLWNQQKFVLFQEQIFFSSTFFVHSLHVQIFQLAILV